MGNLTYSTTEDDLLDYFAKCGAIKSAKVLKGGKAFIKFEAEEGV